VQHREAPIEDVQGSADARGIAIDEVGVKDLRHPIRVAGAAGVEQYTVAELSMSVSLPHNHKGTHMSRFLERLNSQEQAISLESFARLLEQTMHHLEAPSVQIEMAFPYFVIKRAPVSGAESLMDYRAAIHGRHRLGRTDLWLKVIVPVTSLCPCSKSISAYGAHNQRAHITITAKIGGSIWFEDLIGMAESVASSELYSMLKRPDEKYVTERAYDNPKFVEDVVRDAALALHEDPRVRSYKVESENFESIHNHSAYAMIDFDKELPLSSARIAPPDDPKNRT
jgi:GTP cyclohydrolase I